jgi:hypothetical protein
VPTVHGERSPQNDSAAPLKCSHFARGTQIHLDTSLAQSGRYGLSYFSG